MEYPEIAIKALIDSLDENEESYKWLTDNQFRELAALSDFLNDDSQTALEFLIQNKNKYITIVSFLAALQNEDKAFDLLMKGSDREWAAVVSAVHGDEEAYQWLIKNNFKVYAELADTLIENSGKGNSGNITGIGDGGGGGFSGGGGDFGGFGGGSFGGAGGGGNW